ncbi:hypothetical protein YC2023_033061 [Brassica napus]
MGGVTLLARSAPRSSVANLHSSPYDVRGLTGSNATVAVAVAGVCGCGRLRFLASEQKKEKLFTEFFDEERWRRSHGLDPAHRALGFNMSVTKFWESRRNHQRDQNLQLKILGLVL